MPNPPEIERKKPMSRFTNRNRNNKNKNKNGLRIPSKNPNNYEPNIMENAMLVNATTGYNYKKKANVNAKQAWANYTRKRNQIKKNGNK